MEAPDERFAALLGGREAALACEELVLRARADADAGRDREAALQARIALESLLSEMEKLPAARRAGAGGGPGPGGPGGQRRAAGAGGPRRRPTRSQAAWPGWRRPCARHRLGSGR